MADDRFDIDITDALTTAERDEEAELKKQVTLATGQIVGKVKKLANGGELEKLTVINSVIDRVIAGETPRRDRTQGPDTDRPQRRDSRDRDDRPRSNRRSQQGRGGIRGALSRGSDRSRSDHRAP